MIPKLFIHVSLIRTWCKMTVPILWNDPAKRFQTYPINELYENLFNTILLHLSEQSSNNLENQGIDIFIKIYQQQQQP